MEKNEYPLAVLIQHLERDFVEGIPASAELYQVILDYDSNNTEHPLKNTFSLWLSTFDNSIYWMHFTSPDKEFILKRRISDLCEASRSGYTKWVSIIGHSDQFVCYLPSTIIAVNYFKKEHTRK